MPVSAELVGRGSGEHRRTYSQVRVEANLPRNIFFDTSVDTHVLSHIEANMIKELTTGDAVFDEKTRFFIEDRIACCEFLDHISLDV